MIGLKHLVDLAEKKVKRVPGRGGTLILGEGHQPMRSHYLTSVHFDQVNGNECKGQVKPK